MVGRNVEAWAQPSLPFLCWQHGRVERTVTTHLDLGLSGPTKLVFSIAVAQGAPLARESLAVTSTASR